MSEGSEPFSFLKGVENAVAPRDGEKFDWDAATSIVRASMADALNARHLSFLLGSGCSSLMREGKQLGVPTMGPMAQSFLKSEGEPEDNLLITQTERERLVNGLGLDVRSARFESNLERLMEALYGSHFVLQAAETDALKTLRSTVESVIRKIKRYILTCCSEGPFAEGDESVLSLYDKFYLKLLLRDGSLPRPWVFTTNYDLFNERAMDRRSIPYCNGFSGLIERRFNPSVFRYTLAEQLDITARRWNAVASYVYFCKLHGSINWFEDDETLFPIRESACPDIELERLLIYPTPAKQSASFVSPYSDLFREFQSQVVRDQSVLITIGYSFGDQHVNNIIFQALTLPNFRLIAFVPEDTGGVVGQLRGLQDPRIWMIGGDTMLSLRPAHYFETVVTQFMPATPAQKVDEAVAKVLSSLIKGPGSTSGMDRDSD